MIDIEMQGRSTLRRAVRIYCETVLEPGFRRIGVRSRDLSLAGALLETEEVEAEVGDEVFLAFKAPHTRLWIDARARIVRVLHGRRREDEGRLGLGVEFIELDRIYRAVLDGALRHIPPPLPTRPQRETWSLVTVDLSD